MRIKVTTTATRERRIQFNATEVFLALRDYYYKKSYPHCASEDMELGNVAIDGIDPRDEATDVVLTLTKVVARD